MGIERKGFLSLGCAYIITSTMTVCKVIRDKAEAQKLADAAKHGIVPMLGIRGTMAALNGSIEYSASAFLSWLVAVGAIVGGIVKMPLSREQRLFLSMGVASLISSTTTLAKHVRDQQDALKWQAL